MASKVDLTYTKDGMFTKFLPESDKGVEAWNTMAKELDGVSTVLNIHADSIIKQLRDSGYIVEKQKLKSSAISDNELLQELISDVLDNTE